jgi:hypothetical protein
MLTAMPVSSEILFGPQPSFVKQRLPCWFKPKAHIRRLLDDPRSKEMVLPSPRSHATCLPDWQGNRNGRKAFLFTYFRVITTTPMTRRSNSTIASPEYPGTVANMAAPKNPCEIKAAPRAFLNKPKAVLPSAPTGSIAVLSPRLPRSLGRV